MRRFAVVGAAVALAAGLLPTAAPAASLVGCSFDEAMGVMRVDIRGGDLAVVLRRGSHGGILVDGKPCGATVFNTDRIRVVGNAEDQTLVIDLGGGRFGPGRSDDGTRIAEIEISFEAGHGTDGWQVWGSGHADDLYVSKAGMRLNGDGDTDAWSYGVEQAELFGRGGQDSLQVNGYHAKVYADAGEGSDVVKGYLFSERLAGGSGNDLIVAFGGNDRINAGPGNDRVRAGDGNDRIRVGDSEIEQEILCGPGTDTVQTWDAGDDGVATGCEKWAT